MKVNFSAVITDLKNKPMQDADKADITLADIAVAALNATQEATLAAKREAYGLMQKIANGGEVELELEQVNLILGRIAAGPWTPMVVGRCDAILSQKELTS